MTADTDSSATGIARRIDKGEVTSEEICLALCEKIEARTDLNAYSTFDRAGLMAQAKEADIAKALGNVRGPLHGVPLILKDNINTAAMATSGGTPALVGNMPPRNAPIAARLFQAGALLAGKANMHELSSGGTSANHTFGPVRNPYNEACIPGGSSGGTAAAIAAGLAPAGMGTDTAGSVRVPSALCGVYGFRPTTGRYSGEGIVPLALTQDTAGPLANTLDDIILLDNVLALAPKPIPERTTKSLRIGIAQNLMETSTPAVTQVIDKAFTSLSKARAHLVPIDFNPLRDLQLAASVGVIDMEFPGVMREYLKKYAPHLSIEAVVEAVASPSVKSFTRERLEKEFDSEAYARATGPDLDAYQAAWKALLDKHQLDAIAFPTTPDIALPLAEDDSIIKDGEVIFSWFYFRHTGMGAIGQRPGISIPAGLSQSGMPVGLELDGFPGKDEDLLAVARAVVAGLNR
jgi:indoleacetamide hydrolase